MYLRKFFLLVAAVLLPNIAMRAELRQSTVDEFAKATVIEKVIVKNDPTQSYALYLPSTYDPARKHPILYCFDPGARGSLAVARFKEGAEKYNYIVVGSNNSQTDRINR